MDQYQEAYLTATETVPVTDVRLPSHAIPEKYVIHLTPFIIPDNFTIEGHVSIDIDVHEDANNITLHIKGQKISERNCGVFDSPPPHCVLKWGFTRTFPENQDATFKEMPELNFTSF